MSTEYYAQLQLVCYIKYIFSYRSSYQFNVKTLEREKHTFTQKQKKKPFIVFIILEKDKFIHFVIQIYCTEKPLCSSFLGGIATVNYVQRLFQKINNRMASSQLQFLVRKLTDVNFMGLNFFRISRCGVKEMPYAQFIFSMSG